MNKEVIFVSFSGGRTSAYMCWLLKTFFSHKYTFIFVFANTGYEHEETLIFVDRCDKYFDLDLVWLEAVVSNEKNVGTSFKIVSFETASRNCEPFKAVIEAYGIPNADYPHCNRELKLQPIKAYKASLGFKRSHKTAIGIRADEIDRQSANAKEDGLFYPLISWKKTTKPEIVFWWKDMPFDLGIPDHLGNCVCCWKKSLRKLKTIAKNEPSRFDFTAEMESKHGDTGSGDQTRVFFRNYRSTIDILDESKIPFVEVTDYVPQQQYSFTFEIEDQDIEYGCGATCEAA